MTESVIFIREGVIFIRKGSYQKQVSSPNRLMYEKIIYIWVYPT